MVNSGFIKEMTGRYPQLIIVEEEIQKAAECMTACYKNGGKILICGNGGSCSDAGHIVGELMKGFEHKRPLSESLKKKLIAAGGERGEHMAEKLQRGLPAISLADHSSLISAIANDTDPDLVYAQQVIGYGNEGDVLIGISTSGNAQNVLDAMLTARAMNMPVIGLTGETGGKMKQSCDILINVPGKRTCLIQELMLPVYHTLCLTVEDALFGNNIDLSR